MIDPKTTNQRILFYDGECGFCSFWVRFFSERDRKKRIYYAPLQGPTAHQLLPQELTKELSSVVYYNEGKILLKSEAILAAFKEIRYSPDLLFLAQLIPKSLRQRLYDWVARHRHHFLTAPAFCPMPSEELKKQFLD